jgi:hypothetical protein
MESSVLNGSMTVAATLSPAPMPATEASIQLSEAIASRMPV